MEDFTLKEIVTRNWNETQRQSEMLMTLISEMKAVKEQTTKTNGRVTSLETRTGNLEQKHENIYVRVTALSAFATFIAYEVIKRFI